MNVSTATAFICESTGLVESAARALLDNGVEPDRLASPPSGPEADRAAVRAAAWK